MARDQMNPIGRNVRRAVDKTGMTYMEFCHFSGLPYSWLNTIMSAPDEPKWAGYLRKVSRATGVPFDDLMRT